MEVTRTEIHIIKQNNKFYPILNDFCFKAKNLYNHANHIVRENFTKDKRWVRYYELNQVLKNDTEYPDYKNMPTAQSAQQLLYKLDKSWELFFKLIKDWSKHKEKYNTQPKMPNYKNKHLGTTFWLTNQEVKIKGDIVKFPKTFNGFTIKPQFTKLNNLVKFNKACIVPKNNYIKVCLLYTVEIQEPKKDNRRYLGIDIGVDNFATITNTFNNQPFIINGRGLKSINQYYNKQKSIAQSNVSKTTGKIYSQKTKKLIQKRSFKVEDFIHKASRYIVNYAVENNVCAIVIGNNKNWKKNTNMGKINNQKFFYIPFIKFINDIKYKAEEKGITVFIVEESYTSGTSFLDGESPDKIYYNKNRRIKRGLFQSNKGILINSDVNGSFQIIKKVFPNAFANGIEGVVFHPVKINL